MLARVITSLHASAATLNQRVVGSSPTGSTNLSPRDLNRLRGFWFWYRIWGDCAVIPKVIPPPLCGGVGGSPRIIFGRHPRRRRPSCRSTCPRPGLAGRCGLARRWHSPSPDMACSATLCDLLRASRQRRGSACASGALARPSGRRASERTHNVCYMASGAASALVV